MAPHELNQFLKGEPAKPSSDPGLLRLTPRPQLRRRPEFRNRVNRDSPPHARRAAPRLAELQAVLGLFAPG